MKDNWEKVLVRPNSSIKEVLEVITNQSFRIALVTGTDKVLLGTITDGDIRRGLLSNKSLDSEAHEIMNRNPLTINPFVSKEEVSNIMLENDILCLPVIQEGRVINIETLNDIFKVKKYENAVFLMAGGFGKRLKPLTDSMQKTLLKVGNKPILEIILEKLAKAGFYRFFISTHYMPEQVRSHFGDGENWGVEIKYIHEEKPLGTGGALGLLPKEEINEPLILMNGDLLTNLDFKSLLKFHIETNVMATLCINEHKQTIPFGVVESDNGLVTVINEKPTYSYNVNAGIYVLSHKIIKESQANHFMDMPTLINEIIKENKINIFPVHEYWLDIGRMGDYQKANKDVEGL
jgi:dTDP-glucose pyrophosphorylase